MSEVHTWRDFGAGDYGDLGGFRAPPGSWTGLNMKVDRDGSVCPRKGAVSLALTGLSVSAADPFAADPAIDTFSALPKVFVLFGGGRGASFEAEDSPAATWDNYTNAGGASIDVETFTPHLASLPGFTYFGEASDPDDATKHLIVEVDHHGNTMTPMTGSGAGTYKGYRVAIYRDRLYKEADHQDHLGAVYFSEGPDPTALTYAFATFSETAPVDDSADGGWFVVGSKSRIQQMLAWRDSLLFFKDTEVWELRGHPSTNAVLRRLCTLELFGSAGDGYSIPHGQQIQVAGDNAIWIAPPKGRRPMVFDGLRGREVEHIDLGRQGRHLVAPRRDGSGGVVFFDCLQPNGSGTGYDWHYDGKRWTRHLLTRPTIAGHSGTASKWPRQGVVQRAWGTDHLFTVEKESGGTVNVHRYPLATDGPGLENSPYERAGDASSTALNAYLTLPVLEAPSGMQIRPRKVILKTKKWRTGGGSTNNVTVTLGHYDRYRTAQADSTSVSWSEANSSAGAATGDSTSQLIELVPGSVVDCTAVEVRLTAIRGLSIYDVHLVYDLVPTGA